MEMGRGAATHRTTSHRGKSLLILCTTHKWQTLLHRHRHTLSAKPKWVPKTSRVSLGAPPPVSPVQYQGPAINPQVRSMTRKLSFLCSKHTNMVCVYTCSQMSDALNFGYCPVHIFNTFFLLLHLLSTTILSALADEYSLVLYIWMCTDRSWEDLPSQHSSRKARTRCPAYWAKA
jgi:hypothetical protein